MMDVDTIAVETATCVHRWVIPEQGGRGKRHRPDGRCSKCGTTKSFSNHPPYDAAKARDRAGNQR